ncbi:MAG TPA: LysM peptidoglycan-binding domain-containing protein [Ktedonobacteraceae bacterium]|nr:LysM peptidoglycan-binding domain-containing protein [Ktedonobacteraceae bacterium]
MTKWHKPRLGRSQAVVCASAFGLTAVLFGILPQLNLPLSFLSGGIPVARASSGNPLKQTSLTDGCYWYTVASGDTLSGIAYEYGVTVDQILAANANTISDPNLIFVNQQLCIPPSNGTSEPIVPNSGSAQGEVAFVNFVLPYAQRASADTGWPVSVILAQWGLEQGWSTPGFDGYNFGNCGAYPGVPTVPGTDAPGSPPAFAYAATPEDGLTFYLHVAHLSFYDAVAPAAQTGGPDAAARALGESPWDAGHYTVVNDPGSSLLAIMKDFNLYQYD